MAPIGTTCVLLLRNLLNARMFIEVYLFMVNEQ